jgi:glycosidase
VTPTPGSTWDRNIANNKWENLPQPPISDEPYDRQWLGTLTVFTMPGMPLLYYGDEYGEFGGGDPDNRHLMRLGSQLSPHEKAQLDRMSRLMKARQSLRGLRRGKLVTALLSEDLYAYARPDAEPDAGSAGGAESTGDADGGLGADSQRAGLDRRSDADRPANRKHAGGAWSRWSPVGDGACARRRGAVAKVARAVLPRPLRVR